LAKILKDAKFVELKDAPHGFLVTHVDEVKAAMLDFLGPAPKDFKQPRPVGEISLQ
jgi:hypothetical protein